MNQEIFEQWAGDELVTCTEDQEICAISGRNGKVWQIINHVISHSLFLCTYYLIEVPAKYSCQLKQLYLGLKVNKVILIEWLMRGGSVFVKKASKFSLLHTACYFDWSHSTPQDFVTSQSNICIRVHVTSCAQQPYLFFLFPSLLSGRIASLRDETGAVS